MSCILTGGYNLGCRDSQGGIKNVYISNFDAVDSITLDTDGSVLTIVADGSPATPSFYKFEQDIEVASFTEAGQYSTENGTAFYEQTVEITIIGSTQAILNQVKSLGQGAWRILLQDQNGTYKMVGVNNPVRTTAGAGGSGKAMGDLNGYKITFTGKDPVPAPVVASATALAHIVAS